MTSSLSPSASPRIVVIGAGILGCSAAYHLLKAGVSDVSLLDAVRAGGGTSGAGAGFVSHWSAGFLEHFGEEGIALQKYGLDFYRDWRKRERRSATGRRARCNSPSPRKATSDSRGRSSTHRMRRRAPGASPSTSWAC